MSVTVRLPPGAAGRAGGARTVELDAATCAARSPTLVDQYPGLRQKLLDGDGDLNRFVNVYVDGEDVRLGEASTRACSDGSTLIVLPAMAGGAGEHRARRRRAARRDRVGRSATRRSSSWRSCRPRPASACSRSSSPRTRPARSRIASRSRCSTPPRQRASWPGRTHPRALERQHRHRARGARPRPRLPGAHRPARVRRRASASRCSRRSAPRSSARPASSARTAPWRSRASSPRPTARCTCPSSTRTRRTRARTTARPPSRSSRSAPRSTRSSPGWDGRHADGRRPARCARRPGRADHRGRAARRATTSRACARSRTATCPRCSTSRSSTASCSCRTPRRCAGCAPGARGGHLRRRLRRRRRARRDARRARARGPREHRHAVRRRRLEVPLRGALGSRRGPARRAMEQGSGGKSWFHGQHARSGGSKRAGMDAGSQGRRDACSRAGIRPREAPWLLGSLRRPRVAAGLAVGRLFA